MKGIKVRILFSFLMILALIGLVRTVSAAGAESVVERPLSDWLENNPYGARWLVGKYVICMGANPLIDFNTLPDGEGVFPDPEGGEAGLWDSVLAMTEGETVTTGSVFEKTMPDGTAEITVEINVENGPLTIYRWDEFIEYINARRADPDNEDLRNNPPEPVLGEREDGSIDYKQTLKITNPAPGMDIAVIYQYIFGQIPGGNLKAWSFSGTGSGTYTAHAADFIDWHFTPGTTGTVHVPGGLGVGKPAKVQGEAFETSIFDLEVGKVGLK